MIILLLLLAVEVPLGLDRGLLAPPENPLTEEKIALGRRLFFDKRLSGDNTLACADCHQPERGFSDGKQLAVGVKNQTGNRNTPAIINRAYGRSFFWDGRIATLEEQVLQPIEDPKEMGADLTAVVEKLRTDPVCSTLFQAVFGEPPSVRSISYAIASHVRTLLSGNSTYDRFEAGDKTALTAIQQEGLRLFRGKARCATCHSGSNLTDEEFHNTGVSWDREPPDPGRAAVTGNPKDEGKFKTPTLRDIAITGPYMHDGSLKSLEEVIDFYDRGGGANPNLDADVRPLRLTDSEKRSLHAFLHALTGEPISPWRSSLH